MTRFFTRCCLSVLLLLGAGVGARAWGQCLPVRVLLQAGASGRFALDSLDTYLPASQWTRHTPQPGSTEELFWTHEVPGTQPVTGTPLLDDAQVSLRRASQKQSQVLGQNADLPSFDILLKTRQRACFGAVRTELRRAGLKPEPVSCVNCVGERFVGSVCTVTLFDQRAGYDKGNSPYPFVISVRRNAGSSSVTGAVQAPSHARE